MNTEIIKLKVCSNWRCIYFEQEVKKYGLCWREHRRRVKIINVHGEKK